MGMGAQELKDILEKHRKWLYSEPGGERANLSYANLSSADLRYANLSSADLRYANLSSANLSYANLSSADLSYANLSSADLSYANLSSADLSYANLSYADLSLIKKDFFERLSIIPNEIRGLYDYLKKGKINGQVYEGECACFVGSIAKIAKQNYQSLSSGLKPDANSPTERWFLGILKGDTPENNQVSKITTEWIEEFVKEKGLLVLPTYKVISSDEFPQAFEAMS